MPKYRKKPIVIEAIQYNGKNIKEMRKFCPKLEDIYAVSDGASGNSYIESGQFCIQTLEGNLTVSKNDYIIKGIKGEFYPCKPDIFEATYELVAD